MPPVITVGKKPRLSKEEPLNSIHLNSTLDQLATIYDKVDAHVPSWYFTNLEGCVLLASGHITHFKLPHVSKALTANEIMSKAIASRGFKHNDLFAECLGVALQRGNLR